MKPYHLLLIGLVFTQGCAPLNPDWMPPPPKCEVWVYDHSGHAECISREAARKWACKNLGCDL